MDAPYSVLDNGFDKVFYRGIFKLGISYFLGGGAIDSYSCVDINADSLLAGCNRSQFSMQILVYCYLVL